MKQNIIIGLLAIALAGLFTITKAPAQGRTPQGAATVVIGYTMAYEYTPPGYREKGMVVQWVNRSSSAPEIIVGSNIADIMASLQDLGFELAPQTDRPILIFNRPPR